MKDLNNSLIKGWVDNSLTVKVPFFAFTFDINDLGLISSIGFLVILVCFRFCITRELENLRISFAKARELNKSEAFYHLLAMKQVFTVPKTEHINQTFFLLLAPKIITLFPFFIYLCVSIHDLLTSWIGNGLHRLRFQALIGIEIITLIFMGILTFMVIVRMLKLDLLWEEESSVLNKRDMSTKRMRLYYRVTDWLIEFDFHGEKIIDQKTSENKLTETI